MRVKHRSTVAFFVDWMLSFVPFVVASHRTDLCLLSQQKGPNNLDDTLLTLMALMKLKRFFE